MKMSGLLAVAALSFAGAIHAEEHVVHMLTSGSNGDTMVMEPAYLKIAKGDTVKFVPEDVTHNAESFSVPEGAEAFATPLGEEAAVSFAAEGVYLYQCNPHSIMGMLGVIQVGEASNLDQVKADWEAKKPTVVMNAERMDTYLGKVQ